MVFRFYLFKYFFSFRFDRYSDEMKLLFYLYPHLSWCKCTFEECECTQINSNKHTESWVIVFFKWINEKWNIQNGSSNNNNELKRAKREMLHTLHAHTHMHTDTISVTLVFNLNFAIVAERGKKVSQAVDESKQECEKKAQNCFLFI